MKSLLRRISHLDRLIHEGCTGSPASLGRKIGVSERSIFEYLKLMKRMGAPISYSRSKGSYFYHETGRFNVGFKTKNNAPYQK